MHKRTIRLAISTIMLALVVSVPVDAAGQRRAEQRQRERAPRASTPRARSAPRDAAPRARSTPRRAVPRASTPRARPAPRDSDRRDSFRRGFGQFGFGRRGGFRSRFNFNFQLGTPQYYPPYSWERMPYNSGCRWWDEPSYSVVYRGGRYVRQYFCVNNRNLY